MQENLHETPVYGGWVDAKGPRYCPSIEDKIVRWGLLCCAVLCMLSCC